MLAESRDRGDGLRDANLCRPFDFSHNKSSCDKVEGSLVSNGRFTRAEIGWLLETMSPMNLRASSLDACCVDCDRDDLLDGSAMHATHRK